MKKILILVTALFLICTAAACADTLTLPASLTVIEEEAFFGNTSLDEVVLPEGLTEIRADAFAGSSLSSINLPSTLTSIADGALPAPGTVTVTATEGSWAYKWALENGYIDVQSGIPINKTLFPDAGFRMFVQQAFDIDKNCILSDEETSAVKMIALTNEEVPVRSLDGVGCFTALEEIHISDGHEFSSLDLSKNTGLKSLECSGCGLAALDVSHNTNLQYLDCSNNALTTLELSQNRNLDYLDCNSNRLTKLDVSHCPAISRNTDNLSVDSEVEVTYATGYCGNSVNWKLVDNTFIVFGSGKMYSFTERYKLWWYLVYDYRDRISEVVIEPGITSVGNYMFYGCQNLVKITFPEDLTSIGVEAFRDCVSLTDVVLPAGLQALGDQAFSGCNCLAEELTIPCGITGRWVFADCALLKKVSILEGATVIGEGTFMGCVNLAEVGIPSTVTEIRKNAFTSCESLESIEIPSSVTEFGWGAFSNSGITSLVIPDGVTAISASMFGDCQSLTYVVIPTSVTYIGERAFCGSDNLRYVYYAGSPEQWEEIEIEDDWDGHMPGWNGYNSDYDSYNQPVYNAIKVFGIIGGQSKLVSGILRQGEGWAIGWQIAYDEDDQGNKMNAQLSIYLSGNSESEGSIDMVPIQENTFQMPWLTDEYGFKKSDFIRIDVYGGYINKLQIFSNTFKDYTNVDRVILSNVNLIQGHAFEGCTGLKSVYCDSPLSIVGPAAFKNCTQLATFSITSGINRIYDEAFRNTMINTFNFSETVEIGDYAFSDSNLTGEYSLSKVERIGNYAFSNNNTARVTLGKQVREIGEGAFTGCDNLVIECLYDSYAYWYAKNNGIRYELLITHSLPLEYYLQNDSTQYDHDLALITAELSDAAYGGGQYTSDLSIRNILYEYGFQDDQIYSNYGGFNSYFSGSFQYVIATKPFEDDTLDNTDIMIVVAQGTKNRNEGAQDLFSGHGTHTVLGFETYDVAWDFYHDITEGKESDNISGIWDIVNPDKNYKVLLTGHSLGGAAINLVAAELTNRFYGKDNVYCYTYGALDPFPSSSNIVNGYENIHNVYNLADTFAPDHFGADNIASGMMKMYGKFGVLDTFNYDWRDSWNSIMPAPIQIIQSVNHAMEKYVEAVKCGLIDS